jgi:hypothetical protein
MENTSSLQRFPMHFFGESNLVPPENEKYCFDVSRTGHTGMHYVACRSYQMQKHKFSVMYHGALFVESVSVPPEQQK